MEGALFAALVESGNRIGTPSKATFAHISGPCVSCGMLIPCITLQLRI